jgi:hypothetical protein
LDYVKGPIEVHLTRSFPGGMRHRQKFCKWTYASVRDENIDSPKSFSSSLNDLARYII